MLPCRPMRHSLPLLLLLCAASAFGTAAHDLPPAEIDGFIRDAIGSPAAGNLADYANVIGAAADRFENSAEAARRILAVTPATKQSVDSTIEVLHRLAEAESSPSIERQLAGRRARFHAHRLVAAVHYNLFKRSLRLAELVAATYAEKEAIAAWRRMVHAATLAQHPSVSTLRADLEKYEASLRELEEQCCPPDEAILKEKVWQPATRLPANNSRPQ